MGRLVKLIGTGIGLAHEAYAARKETKARNQAYASREAREDSFTTTNQTDCYEDAPPQYLEVADHQAEELIASGNAVALNATEEKQVRQYQEEIDTAAEQRDEEQWALDDAADSQRSHTSNEDEPAGDANQIMDAFIKSHPPPDHRASPHRARLPCPVILPQRRPRDKKRGFVRAYAPVLADCGISQAMFLDFLKTFKAASKASPWLQVVNMAAAGAGLAPSVIAMGVSMGVQVVVGIAMEVQRRTRSNTFLDRMNNEFFAPRGLYCLIMTYAPDDPTTNTIDITQTITNYSAPASSNMKQTLRNLRVSSGKTYGAMQMPESAPLIFPSLDEQLDKGFKSASASASASTTPLQNPRPNGSLKTTSKYLSDYFDRRAQAKYASSDPNSPLTLTNLPSDQQQQLQQQQRPFASRYSDPNHPANSGNLVDLVTGGVFDVEGRKRRGIDGRGGFGFGGMRGGGRGGMRDGGGGGGEQKGLVKRMLQKDVLYLMIVNLPSEEERAVGRAAVDAAAAAVDAAEGEGERGYMRRI